MTHDDIVRCGFQDDKIVIVCCLNNNQQNGLVFYKSKHQVQTRLVFNSIPALQGNYMAEYLAERQKQVTYLELVFPLYI
jgi:hypothetical protein